MIRGASPRITRFIPARAGNTGAGRHKLTGLPVHPRSRGEHLAARIAALGPPGSSPLARGTLRTRRATTNQHRFIPARAGNTETRPRRRSGLAVHPRSRGEHTRLMRISPKSTGSSPLARGTRTATVRPERRVRFIPARAGNTTAPRPAWDTLTVHPRSRGEHICSASLPCRSAGSSPLARGTRHLQRADAGHHRFIPARAGNTRAATPRQTRRPVHPRSRGEHYRRRGGIRMTDGSSPLARGTRPGAERHGLRHRFIPARAGNTVFERSCRALCCGSSPLARGTRVSDHLVVPEYRFIPARAGNTAYRAWSCRPSTVHPRSRGEHCVPEAALGQADGSSPLARGTRGR